MESNNCRHPEREIKIIQFYRKNYPFGKKSERFHYSIRMCKKVCERCGKEINRWKP
jgi:hypothetical protein